jgi:hypothetical protein
MTGGGDVQVGFAWYGIYSILPNGFLVREYNNSQNYIYIGIYPKY